MLTELLENGTHKRSYAVEVEEKDFTGFLTELLEAKLSPTVTKYDGNMYYVEFEVWVERGATEDD